ncbi:xylulokinase [Aquirufa sp. ROCK-SH2]
MLLCGIDVGTSSIKVSIVDSANQKVLQSVSFPEIENIISSPELGFAEQEPEHWWYCVKQAILLANSSNKYNPKDIAAIGISYQMHGLVVVDHNDQVLRPSIIWCDSRASELGNEAYKGIGEAFCNDHLLNSPGNFTASKLAWVKKHQPEIFKHIKHVLLPGDFIAFKLCGNYTTTPSALSEGIFWDFQTKSISKEVNAFFGFSDSFFPEVKPVFSEHGQILASIASDLGLNEQVKVSYKAGDQPNNALSLGVIEPGEIATTAGTSGVVYGVSEELKFDKENRVNSFAHVNYTDDLQRIGVLMCINGTGILNRWLKDNFFSNLNYNEMNQLAAESVIGSKGLVCMPFGNGAERIFQNKNIGASFKNLDFNQHRNSEIIRSAQEGIAFSMVYGIELLKNVGIVPNRLKAGFANMYLSDIFSSAIVNASGVELDFCEGDGSFGAAIGAGIGINLYASPKEAVNNIQVTKSLIPNKNLKEEYLDAYSRWKESLMS